MTITPNSVDPWQKVRQQFDFSPYPSVSLDRSPKQELEKLYVHNLSTAFYLRDKTVVSTKGKVILDAGCGSGYKALTLAEANPGARIVGIDISEQSINLAQQRLKYHGFDNFEFHVLNIEKLSKLEQKFDYINCDETLYLLPDTIVGLKALKNALKPEGILRVNFHSSLQRIHYFRSQAVTQLMGLMDNDNQNEAITRVRDLMANLKDSVHLKKKVWHENHEIRNQSLLVNHLFREDKGLNILDFFSALESANLKFIRMVDWQTWNLMELFNKSEDLPNWLSQVLANASTAEKLHLYELFEPHHRLLDLWCGHPQQKQDFSILANWQAQEWERGIIYLHPQLKTQAAKAKIKACALTLQPLQLQEVLPLPGECVQLDSLLAACLLPLWHQPQPFTNLVKHWQQLRPLNPVTLTPSHPQDAFRIVQQMVQYLESLGYLMVELP